MSSLRSGQVAGAELDEPVDQLVERDVAIALDIANRSNGSKGRSVP